MDKQKELLFCTNFIKKEKRDRIFYELQTPKKRNRVLIPFSHEAEKMIKSSTIYNKSHCSNVLDILSLIQRVSSSKQGYIITINKEADGCCFYLEQAVSLGIHTGMAFIVIIDGETALIREEQCFGAPPVFLLHKH